MEVRTLGRLIPESGKLHQNQEIYDIRGGGSPTLKATHHKDPPKVLIGVKRNVHQTSD